MTQNPRQVRGRLGLGRAARLWAGRRPLPGASWQRSRTHCAANLMAVTPKSARAGSGRCCTTSMTSPRPHPCTPSSAGSHTPWQTSSRRELPTSTQPAPTSWPSPDSRRRSGGRSGPQPARTAEPRDPSPQRRRRRLSGPRCADPPGRRGPCRAARRMDRDAPPHRPRRPRQIQAHHHRRGHPAREDHADRHYRLKSQLRIIRCVFTHAAGRDPSLRWQIRSRSLTTRQPQVPGLPRGVPRLDLAKKCFACAADGDFFARPR
jgi:hypothetical protein